MVGYESRTIVRRGGDYTLLETDGAQRAGVLAVPADDVVPVWLSFFGVNDPAAAAAKAEALGGEIVLPPSPEVRGGTIAIVTDPAGAVLVLQQWDVAGGEG